jgi:hypothetical protein
MSVVSTWMSRGQHTDSRPPDLSFGSARWVALFGGKQETRARLILIFVLVPNSQLNLNSQQ